MTTSHPPHSHTIVLDDIVHHPHNRENEPGINIYEADSNVQVFKVNDKPVLKKNLVALVNIIIVSFIIFAIVFVLYRYSKPIKDLDKYTEYEDVINTVLSLIFEIIQFVVKLNVLHFLI